jgi:hypothetical protein
MGGPTDFDSEGLKVGEGRHRVFLVDEATFPRPHATLPVASAPGGMCGLVGECPQPDEAQI